MEKNMTLQEIKKMPVKAKEEFLFNDLAERMIRVEQNVSKSFNKPVEMRDTEYYRSLTGEQKESLQKFLRAKKKKSAFSILGLILPLMILSFFNFSFTGNAIADNVGEQAFSYLEFILISVFGFLALILIGIAISKTLVEKRLHRHIDIIAPYLSRKHIQINSRFGQK